MAGTSPESLLPAHSDLVERVVSFAARRSSYSREEREDLQSWVTLRLLEDGDSILAKFQGRSGLETYLTVVVKNLCRDYRTKQWGRWRPSAAADRLGDAGKRLDVLISRDGRTVDEAVETVMSNGETGHPRRELLAMAAKLPDRPRRRFVSEEVLEEIGTSDGVEERLLDREREHTAERVKESLIGALEALDAEDRLLLKMCKGTGFKVSEAARTLGLEQRPLYRRLERSCASIREEFEARGITQEEVRQLYGWERLDLGVDLNPEQDTGLDPVSGDGSDDDPDSQSDTQVKGASDFRLIERSRSTDESGE